MDSRFPRARVWLRLGLALHLLAVALVAPRILQPRRAPAAEGAGAPSVPSEPADRPAVSAGRAAEAGRREDASHAELRTRVGSATAALAEALESPDYAAEPWRAAVAERARTLGSEALPALLALLADEQRSVEEHVAATELAAALRR
ncbi:MAG TPA: hypothetical protein VF530_14445 [Planctomycetota bacterium]